MIILICILTLVFTVIGGLFAIKFKDKLHLILGFSAGAVMGVAFFDLLPEALALGGSTIIVASGFILYMILDRFFLLHSHNERGVLGAGSLSIHSLLDGIAIGVAFQVSITIGSIVAIAVLVHDFSDGINTVNMILKNNGNKRQALKWLWVDAIAPVIGIILTLFFTLSEKNLGVILSLFAGFFLYIGASDLLPESHHDHPTVWTTISTILGMVVIFIAISIVKI